MYEKGNTYRRLLGMTESDDYKVLLTLLIKSFEISEKKDISRSNIKENYEYLSLLNEILKEVKNEFKNTEKENFLAEQIIVIDNELTKEKEVINAN